MPLDPSPLLRTAAELVDRIEAEYGPDATLVDAVILVEIHHTDEDDDQVSTIEGKSIGGRNTASIGIVTRGLNALTDTQA